MSDEWLSSLVIIGMIVVAVVGGILFFVHIEHADARVLTCIQSGRAPIECREILGVHP